MKRKTKEEVAIAHNKMICEIDKITRDFSKKPKCLHRPPRKEKPKAKSPA